jgi:DNA primase
MDTIAVARAGFGNVVASCGTSLAEAQVKLLGRFTRRVVVNYDPDAAGQAATERSLVLLLEQGFDVRVLELPRVGDRVADPDLFIRERGADAYRRALAAAPAFVEYLIQRTRSLHAAGLNTPESKLQAMNYLLPYIQRIPNRLLRSEWATRIASELRIEEPVLREALRRAAAERRSEVQARPELLGAGPKPAERRLIQLLSEAEGFRQKLAQEIAAGELHRGLVTEKIFEALLPACLEGEAPDANAVAAALEEADRRLLFAILFEPAAEPAWAEAESCLSVLRRRKIEAELARVQQAIEANPSDEELRVLLARKQELRQRLASV